MSPPLNLQTPSKKRKLSSAAWEYFTPVEPEDGEDDSKTASCDVCKTVISYKNSSNLRRHLKRKHAHLITLNIKEEGFDNDDNEELDVTAEEASEEKPAPKSSPPKKKRHKTESPQRNGFEEALTEDKNDLSVTGTENGETRGSTLNPALVVVENILGQLPKKVRIKAEIDILNMAYSLYSKHCE